jgi:hypothetical protein
VIESMAAGVRAGRGAVVRRVGVADVIVDLVHTDQQVTEGALRKVAVETIRRRRKRSVTSGILRGDEARAV